MGTPPSSASPASSASSTPASASDQVEPPPLVEDVTFRMSQRGDAIGFDLECRDGQVRRLIFPIDTLPKLLAGFLWSGAESAARVAPTPPTDDLRERLQDGARLATAARLVRIEGVDEVILELEVGAALFAVRLPDGWAETLGVSLLEFVRRKTDIAAQ